MQEVVYGQCLTWKQDPLSHPVSYFKSAILNHDHSLYFSFKQAF